MLIRSTIIKPDRFQNAFVFDIQDIVAGIVDSGKDCGLGIFLPYKIDTAAHIIPPDGSVVAGPDIEEFSVLVYQHEILPVCKLGELILIKNNELELVCLFVTSITYD